MNIEDKIMSDEQVLQQLQIALDAAKELKVLLMSIINKTDAELERLKNE